MDKTVWFLKKALDGVLLQCYIPPRFTEKAEAAPASTDAREERNHLLNITPETALFGFDYYFFSQAGGYPH